MRGEHWVEVQQLIGYAGSSPHARGALSEAVAKAVKKGIIPACAGSTVVKLSTKEYSGDHPRMRGEHRHRTGVGW